MHRQTYLSSQKWILWPDVLELKHRTPKRFLLWLHYFLTLLNYHVKVYPGRHVPVTSISEKSQPSLEHNSHIHTTFCKRILWYISTCFSVSPTQAHILYYNSCLEMRGHGQHSPLAVLLIPCAVVLPAPGNRHLTSGPLTSTIGQLFITWQLLVMSGMFWSGAVWSATAITTKYNDSELPGNCTFPGLCLHLLSRVSLRGTSRAPISQRATRQAGKTEASTSYWFTVQRQPLLISSTWFNRTLTLLSHPNLFLQESQVFSNDSNCHSRQHLRSTAHNLGKTHRYWRLSFPKIKIIQS